MKIAICGKNQLCLCDTPWSDKKWQIWGLNIHSEELNYLFPRFDLWFDIHKFNELELPYYLPSLNTKYGKFLKTNQDKLILAAESKLLPKAKGYPLQEIINEFDCNYLKCSIAYMIAYAIYIGATEIALFGVDPPDDEKYRDQEENICFWMGIAKGKGIKIYNSCMSEMLKTDVLYGFDISVLPEL